VPSPRFIFPIPAPPLLFGAKVIKNQADRAPAARQPTAVPVSAPTEKRVGGAAIAIVDDGVGDGDNVVVCDVVCDSVPDGEEEAVGVTVCDDVLEGDADDEAVNLTPQAKELFARTEYVHTLNSSYSSIIKSGTLGSH